MNASQSPKLTVAVISYNEEEDLPGFLENVLQWADEVVIVDDGSHDKTVEIAKSAGDKIVFLSLPRNNEEGFSDQRNKCIANASGNWILHMDVDERVPPDLADEIMEAIKCSENNAWKYSRLNFFLNKPLNGGGWQYWNKPQLARKGFHHFENRVHEKCIVEGGSDKVGQLKCKMWHLNDRDYVERVRKNLQYMQFSGDEILVSGIKIKWYHILFYPLWRGMRSYFFQGGYREGARGLIFAIYTFTSTFNWWAYAWDKQNRIPREEVEKQIQEKWKEKNFRKL